MVPERNRWSRILGGHPIRYENNGGNRVIGFHFVFDPLQSITIRLLGLNGSRPKLAWIRPLAAETPKEFLLKRFLGELRK